MSSSHQLWFYAEALSARFVQDLDEALQASHITQSQHRWLRTAADGSLLADGAAKPRVDSLKSNQRELINVHLASALMFSDQPDNAAQVFLHTPFNGVERFDSRQHLLEALVTRFAYNGGKPVEIACELVEGNLFEQRMLAMLDQQVEWLQLVQRRLERLPSLRHAAGVALQRQIDPLLPHAGVDVFTHLLQIKEQPDASRGDICLGTQTMVDAGLRHFLGASLGDGLVEQFLDAQGKQLTADQSAVYKQALGRIGVSLTAVYEEQLAVYWNAPAVDGINHRGLASQAIAECFRQRLQASRYAGAITDKEYRGLSGLCVSGEVLPGITGLEVSRVAITLHHREPVKLAGVLLAQFKNEPLGGLFIYCSLHGLRRFKNLAELSGHFAGINGRLELFGYTSLNDTPLLKGAGPLKLRLDAITHSPFSSCIDSIIALQKRDLASILQKPFKTLGQADVDIDDALDIRNLIDFRLKGHNGRWSESMASFEERLSQLNSPSRVSELGRGDEAIDAVSMSWAKYLRDTRGLLDQMMQAHPTVHDCARSLLNRYLSILHEDDSDSLRMWYRDENDKVVSLPGLLLERVTGCRGGGVPGECAVHYDGLESGHSQYLSWLTPSVLERVLAGAHQAFSIEYARRYHAFHSSQMRIINSKVIPAGASRWITEGLMRLDLSMEHRSGDLSDEALAMFRQVLNLPVFSLREAFGNEATEIYVPFLVYDARQPPIALTNIVVLQKPLSGHATLVMWSAVAGLREISTVAQLQSELNTRLAFRGTQDKWLQLVAQPDREKLRRFLKQNDSRPVIVNLARVEGHFIEHLQDGELSRQRRNLEHGYLTALEWRADAVLFDKMLAPMAVDDMARETISGLSTRLETAMISALIPDWLKHASISDLFEYQRQLTQFHHLYSSPSPLPRVFGLDDYAHDQLFTRLDHDFPDAQLDPSRITVSLIRYTPAPTGTGEIPSSLPGATQTISQSLTQFAISRFSGIQDATLAVSSAESVPLPAGLDAPYVRELVRSLDVGAGYKVYLERSLDEKAPEYPERLRQFMEQAPCALLLTAFQLKLQGKLSDAAYDYIENVLQMPDGFARLPVAGVNIIFSPLKLVCAPGYAADVVTGVYLITPDRLNEGPWVLQGIADSEFFYKEYATQDAFLTDLRTSTRLQALILQRLEPDVRYVYERDGFIQPHLSWFADAFSDLSGPRPGPVQLNVEAVQENVLHCLMRGTRQVMTILAAAASVTNEQAASRSARFLGMLGAEQLLAFLPGRMGGLVALWQSKDLLQASGKSASERNWGEAAAEFTAALAVLISARQQLQALQPRETQDSGEEQSEILLRGEAHQSERLMRRISRLEVKDVSLSNLVKDELLSVFLSRTDNKLYAAVAGRVYQVRRGGDGWCVADGESDGPQISLDPDQHWQFKLILRDRRNGGIVTRFKTRQTNTELNDIFLIDASGVEEIQRLYPHKAKMIVEGHDQARRYLENALNNLKTTSLQGQLDPRTRQIVTDFFGVRSAGSKLIQAIVKTFIEIYSALLDPEFSPHTSPRYVVGASKIGIDDATAFTFAKDPLRRLFLTEIFFCPPYVRLKPARLRQGGFDRGSHFRGSILIHELSHIACDTHDIAYVDSSVPYLDLLEDTGEYRSRMKRIHEKYQRNLSHLSSRDELFRVEEGGQWQDLRTQDGDGKKVILELTGKSDLDAARDVFLDDDLIRSKILLSNADSVALLATLLGRERFIGSEPGPSGVQRR